MKRPEITREKVKALFETRFIKLFDLQYEEGKHYFDATRRSLNDLVAVKTDEEFREMIPDAVSCFVILKVKGDEPRILMTYEYRYPTGRFLLSPPAGLIDQSDLGGEDPVIVTTKREIHEETGIVVKDTDRVFVVNPCAFSTPGMSDESNALSCAVIELEDLTSLSQEGAEGSECFNGFKLLNKKEAKQVLQEGRDEFGNFYSVYTYAALLYFVSDLWQ